MSRAIAWAERGWLPDVVVRAGIRRLLRQRLRELGAGDCASQLAARQALLEQLSAGPIAVAQQSANAQHYEVPAAFFERILGPRMKYSCCLFAEEHTTLADAEQAMLALTAERARLADGQRILELGCGWGSLTLWMAERFPQAQITAVSNSHSQRAFIERQAAERGLRNLTILTCDVAELTIGERFDRVVSVEMLEHVRNHVELLRRIAGWLLPDGELFVHIFCHREHAYLFDGTSDADWMSQNFFSGGMMPSDAWLAYCQRDLLLAQQWRVSGTHYARTLEAWLTQLDAQRTEIVNLFRASGGPVAAERETQRWRIFLMACAELFAYRGGNEWWVAHYRFTQRPSAAV